MSADTSDGRFDEARKQAAGAADRLVHGALAEHYGVERSDVYSVESLKDDAHDVEAGYDIAQVLDYGGCDVVVDCGDRHVHVAQRIRPSRPTRVDLSLRTETGVDGRTAELEKWLNARNDGGYFPTVIAFGVHDHVIECLQQLVLIDTASVLDALERETLVGETYPTGDGTEARYLAVADIREHADVLAEWEGLIEGGGDGA